MSSPIDYIFMKPLDKCVVDIINILSSSKRSIEIMMRNTILALDDSCYQRQHYCIPSNTKLVPVLCYTLSSLLSSICSSLPWSITIFYVKNVMRITPPLKNSWYKWYLSPSPFFLGPRVVSNRKTDNWTWMCEFKTSSDPIALKLMVDISFLDHWLLNHHSKHWSCYIGPYFGCTFSTNV